VLLTAKADIESKLQGLRFGADAYLTKPFNRKELFITLKNLIDLRLKLQQKYTQMAFDVRQNQENEQENAPTLIYEDTFITNLRVIVENNLANADLDVEFLCKELGMSKTNLYGKMKALTGLSVVIYIRKMRLHKANALLNNTTMNISQIAYEVGYNDPKFFSKLYAEEYGMSPKLAREKNMPDS
jgi:AraC-like DNA-binding protein